MKKIIAGILRRGYSTSKQATLVNCSAYLYPLGYILQAGSPETGKTTVLNGNAFWSPANNANREALIRDILKIQRHNIADGSYFHIINRFENGDHYGIVAQKEAV